MKLRFHHFRALRVLALGLCTSATGQAPQPDDVEMRPIVRQILASYERGRQWTQRCTLTINCKLSSSGIHSPRAATASTTKATMRCNGDRRYLEVRETVESVVDGSPPPPWTDHLVFDGTTAYEWSSRDNEAPDRLGVSEKSGKARAGVVASGIRFAGPALGRLFNGADPDGGDIVQCLRDSSKVTHKSETGSDNIGAYERYFIEAAAPGGGRLAVTFKVAGQHTILEQMRLTKREGDIVRGQTLGANVRKGWNRPVLIEDEIVVDASDTLREGVVVPREARFRYATTYDDGNVVSLEGHMKIEDYDLQPDLTDDDFAVAAPDGTAISFWFDDERTLAYEWRNGAIQQIFDKKLASEIRESIPAPSLPLGEGRLSHSRVSPELFVTIVGAASGIIAATILGYTALRRYQRLRQG